MLAPKELSLDVAIASVLLEVGIILSLKEEQRKALKAYLDGKRTGFVDVISLTSYAPSARYRADKRVICRKQRLRNLNI